ncbi:MAG: diguanylate cyclase [Arcobacteraceae bacterium]|nr:diguanylate cyclase [Arcobacteraceae bacterium]
MNKDNISILAISDSADTLSLIEKFVDSVEHSDLLFSISRNNDEDIRQIVSKNKIDLIIFDINNADDSYCDTTKFLLENNISILFLINKENIDTFINSKFNFSLVDYLIKPIPDVILKHKIDIYLQNLLQKKATEYLINMYDQNVITSKTDTKGIITYSSKAFCDICEYSQEELLGHPHNIVRHPDVPKETYKDMWATIKSGKQWRGEIKNKKKNGGFYWVDVVVSPEFNYKGEIISYTSVRQDISSQKYIEQINTIDYLTKVYNRKYYDEIMEKEIYSASRYDYPLSLMLLDIDYFKCVNDTFGHLVGDSVLKEFANILIENTRKSDIVSRIGGEEFTILVSNDSHESAYAFAQKLRKAIEKYTFTTVENITVSIGISSFIKDDTPISLFKRVDDALYEAKRNGRNCVVRS